MPSGFFRPLLQLFLPLFKNRRTLSKDEVGAGVENGASSAGVQTYFSCTYLPIVNFHGADLTWKPADNKLFVLGYRSVAIP